MILQLKYMPIVMNPARISRVTRNAMVCDRPYPPKKFGDPRFFTFLILSDHFQPAVKVFKKMCTWVVLDAKIFYICSGLACKCVD